MMLWKISQDTKGGYDTYDSAIVAAETETEARLINPEGEWGLVFSAWALSPDDVKVELIGHAIEGTQSGVILASFNAG